MEELLVSVVPRLGLCHRAAHRFVHLHGVALLDRLALFVRAPEDGDLLQHNPPRRAQSTQVSSDLRELRTARRMRTTPERRSGKTTHRRGVVFACCQTASRGSTAEARTVRIRLHLCEYLPIVNCLW